MGWLVSAGVALLALALYAVDGLWVLGIGVLTVLLSHFYSWKPVRLKAWPVANVTSHSLMLSGLLFLAGYFAYGTDPRLGVADRPGDHADLHLRAVVQPNSPTTTSITPPGLHNTAIIVGERVSRLLMYLCVALAIVFFLAAFALGVLPWWLPILAVAGLWDRDADLPTRHGYARWCGRGSQRAHPDSVFDHGQCDDGFLAVAGPVHLDQTAFSTYANPGQHRAGRGFCVASWPGGVPRATFANLPGIHYNPRLIL